MAGDRTAGLAMIDSISGLDRYPYLHAAKAALLALDGELEAAREAYTNAIDRTEGDAERRFLTNRMAALSNADESNPE